MAQGTKRKGHALTFLAVVVGDLALVLHDAFVMIGVDAVHGTTEHLVIEVLAIVGREELVPVARDVET